MATPERLRRLLLGVLVLGISGTFAELLLMSHYEGVYQWLPLGLLTLALATIAWHLMQPGRGTVRALQIAMLLLIAGSAAGIGFHFNGAAEFQLEINPGLGWPELAGKVMRVHSPPLLAPGVMLQFGLIGLIYTYRHPGNGGAGRPSRESEPRP